MAYTPNVWKCGDTITADQLNRLEQAVAELSQGGGESSETLIIREQETQEDENRLYFDKTFNEVYDALESGQRVIEVSGGSEGTIVGQMVITLADANICAVFANHREGSFDTPHYYAEYADGYLYQSRGK